MIRMIRRTWIAFICRLVRPAMKDALDQIRFNEVAAKRYYASLEALEQNHSRLKSKVDRHDLALEGIRVAADGGYRGRNWVLLSFRRGSQEIVHVFDFGSNNMGALIEMLRGFERAGICTTADLPPGVKIKA
jgi:hypothetical protein